MKKVKSIGKFLFKMFEVSLPLLMFGGAFHSYYCGDPWVDTMRWIWAGAIILVLYWFSWSSNKSRKQFCGEMEGILQRNLSMVYAQDKIIKMQEEAIITLQKRIEDDKRSGEQERDNSRCGREL